LAEISFDDHVSVASRAKKVADL